MVVANADFRAFVVSLPGWSLNFNLGYSEAVSPAHPF